MTLWFSLALDRPTVRHACFCDFVHPASSSSISSTVLFAFLWGKQVLIRWFFISKWLAWMCPCSRRVLSTQAISQCSSCYEKDDSWLGFEKVKYLKSYRSSAPSEREASLQGSRPEAEMDSRKTWTNWTDFNDEHHCIICFMFLIFVPFSVCSPRQWDGCQSQAFSADQGSRSSSAAEPGVCAFSERSHGEVLVLTKILSWTSTCLTFYLKRHSPGVL